MRVIGIGQSAAGDDGVGFAVIEALRQQGVPRGIELCIAAEPSSLLSLLETPSSVLLVDAVVGLLVGEVKLLPLETFSQVLTPLSSHGISLTDTIKMARLLFPET